MFSQKILRMVSYLTYLTKKPYEISVGSALINIYFLGANKQFDWPEISLVLDKATNKQGFMIGTTLN